MTDRHRFFYYMAQEGMPLDVVSKILRDAATVQRLAVTACNRELSEREEQSEARACVRIERACTALGWEKPKTSGDPRGACVKLKVPSGRTDDWGQEGLCVPTRRC